MHDASNISAMKVDMPLNWWSDAPTLAIMQSTIGISALEHGTKQPKKSDNHLNYQYELVEHK